MTHPCVHDCCNDRSRVFFSRGKRFPLGSGAELSCGPIATALAEYA
jgi:hypothetical protein